MKNACKVVIPCPGDEDAGPNEYGLVFLTEIMERSEAVPIADCKSEPIPSLFSVKRLATDWRNWEGLGQNKPRRKLKGNGPKDERATVVEVSVANLNFIFEISNLNYPGIYVHVASNSLLGGL